MSFILDALKKSESERQRKGTPGIADVPQSSTVSGRGRWIWIIGALLVINLAVLLVLVKRPGTPAIATAPHETVAPIESSKVALPPPAQRFSEIVAEAKRDQPTPAKPPREPDPQVTSGPAIPPPARPTPGARVVDGPPTFSELRADGTLNIQDLHLDIHVFSSTPSDRFVFINMNRYREGATLDEGPRIAEITPEGVILEFAGMRFLLPRE